MLSLVLLRCVVLCCIVLLCCGMLYFVVVLCCAMLYFVVVLCCAMLYFVVVLCCAMLYFVVVLYDVLRCDWGWVLCCVMCCDVNGVLLKSGPRPDFKKSKF